MAWRFVFQMVASLLLGGITCVMGIVVFERITRTYPSVRVPAAGFYSLLGEQVLIFGGTFVFFMFYMLLFNWRRFIYFNQLSRSVEHISKGHFEDVVPVKQNNEVTLLAENMNLLVTELKRSLDEERRAEQTKNELVTNVSHDLRTPLTSIIGYLGLIEQDRYRDEVELRLYVQIAYSKAERLRLLINDLFEYTRMRHDVVPVKKIAFNLVEMMNQLLVHYRLTLESSGMTGRVIAQEQSLTAVGDPDKLVRVFENLLTNAMTYGAEGHKVDIYLTRDADWAVVQVVNYGEQIPATDLPYLFERFYRVDKSRTEYKSGTGLGLAIAKGLVEKQGGTISVTSDSSGTCFEVRLPRS